MKGYRDDCGGFGELNKTVYDDVFGGPPKFRATTLPPRLEDYNEIFQGFHASRGSSIPVLDLPPDDVWFDVQSSKLDYYEVFGGFIGLDFAVSYEELFKSSKVADDDSSDEVWTPARSESLSDESDPRASLEMNQHASTADTDNLFGVKLRNEPNLEADKDVLNGMINDSQYLDVPKSTALDNKAFTSKIENEKLSSLANNDHRASKEFGGVSEWKWPKKSLDSVCGKERSGSDLSHQKAYPFGNKLLFSVSDLGLKTQPSYLPPPSRPPPALMPKKGDTARFNSKFKTSKNYAFERSSGDHSPPYFDVEIDSSSSAASDAAAMKDALDQAQAKLRNAKELMGRKKEDLQSRSKLQRENNVRDKKGRVNKDYEIELHENLIEIHLNDSDIETAGKLVGPNEKVVNENRFVNDGGAFEWEDYDVGLEEPFEKGDEKGLKETKVQDPKEAQKLSPLEVSKVKHEEEDPEIEGEKMPVKASEQDESDHVLETVFKEDENISQENPMQEEDKINEKIKLMHEMDCILEEDRALQKDPEGEESKKREGVVSENKGIENQQEGNKWEDYDKRLNSTEEPETSTMESSEASDLEKEENLQTERELEKERLRKIEDERERQIEREKDRMVIDRTTIEGRFRAEKATAEAHEGEPPQRFKARLERHKRTSDRAAKALAEKNMRDLLAQKEQAERNRLAEGLDAEIKRWSGGKQGNLRALLSTLQYILGADSGWKAVPLTEVVTTAGLKKAYKKATLCVHPDKLQQRGASIHQKYICEKVFDLLKEAWNKFNSEEP